MIELENLEKAERAKQLSVVDWIFKKRSELGLENDVLPSLRPPDVKKMFRSEKVEMPEVFNPTAKPPTGKKSLGEEEFVYCLPADREAFYNPYDLRLASTEEARYARVCWTLSAKSILRVIEFPMFFKKVTFASNLLV